MTIHSLPRFARRSSPDVLLRLIAVFKLAKGLVLFVAGIGVLRLVHTDLAEVVDTWARELHLDPDGHLNVAALWWAEDLDPRRLGRIGEAMVFYSTLVLTEGVGLLFRQRWAAYLTVVATASFVPLELYEIARRLAVGRVALLVVNLAIVWYLIARLRRE
jgi:uncharacterized membrane protein (DUF2068 family)